MPFTEAMQDRIRRLRLPPPLSRYGAPPEEDEPYRAGRDQYGGDEAGTADSPPPLQDLTESPNYVAPQLREYASSAAPPALRSPRATLGGDTTSAYDTSDPMLPQRVRERISKDSEHGPITKRLSERLAQGSPPHPKHGLLRTIAETAAKAYLGPDLGGMIAHPKYTGEVEEYRRDVGDLMRGSEMEMKTAKDEREKAEHESTLALSGVRTEAAKKAIAREERLAAGPVFPKDAQEAVFRIRQSGLPKDQQDAQVQQVIDDHAALTTPKAEIGHWIEDGKGNLSWIQTPKPGQAPPTPVTFEGVGTPKPPPPTKLLTPEEEAQRIRISQSSRPPGAMASEAAQEELAQSLARGELTRIRDVMSLRSSGNSAAALNVFNRARQLNPKFSTAEIERKIKMESDFTTGRDGQNLQSFGIFLEHAGAASEAIQTVRQTNSPLVLRPINWWKKNVSGDPTFQAFMVSLEPVRKEFEQFLLGGRALYAEDRRAVEVILNDNSTLAQVQSALKQMGHTAKARAQEMNYRYNRVMGKDLEEPFSQEAIVAASKIGVDLTLKPGRGQPQPTAQQREPAGGGDGQTVAGVTVAIPGGKPKWFPTQAKADEFKKAAGLK